MIEIALFTATSFLVGLSGAIAPGPMLTVTISNSMKKGFLAGPLIISGHILMEIVLVILILAGLGWLIGSPAAAFIIGLVGGTVLIVMGLQLFRDSPSPEDDPEKNRSHSNYSSIVSGMATSVSNPYFFIWWATIGGAFMLQGMAMAGILGLIGFLIGHWSSDFVWYSMISFFSSRGSNLMNKKTYQNIMKVCGIFLVGVGSYFFLNAMKII